MRGEIIRDSISAWNAFDDTDFTYSIIGHSHISAVYRYSSGMVGDSERMYGDGSVFNFEDGFRYLAVNPSLAYNRDFKPPGFSIIDMSKKQIEFVYLSGI